MKWLLLLTILSGYSGSSTVAANFDSKDVCEAAAKSHDSALKERACFEALNHSHSESMLPSQA